MKKIHILGCSTCSMTSKLENCDFFDIVKVQISIGDKDYTNIDISNEDIFKTMKENNELGRSSLPSTNAIIEKIIAQKDKISSIIIVTPNRKLSGTYQNCVLVANDLKDQVDVRVIETEAVAMSETIVLEHLIDLVNDNLDIDTIIDNANSFVKGLQSYVSPGSFDYLLASGRVNQLQSMVASFLNLKIMIKIKEGIPEVDCKGRGVKSLHKYLFRECEMFNYKEAYITRILLDDKCYDSLIKLLEKFNIKVVSTYEASPGTAIHFGPSTFGITFR